MEISIQNKKMELIQWLISLDDESIIQKLFDVRNIQLKDWWEDLSNEEMSSIKRGIDDAENGKLISHKEVRSVYEKYL